MAFEPFRLAPDSDITPEAMARGRRAMVHDAAWTSLVGALYGGVVLVGFALELGASPLVIGVLAAIPFLSQLAQLPAVVLIERLRQRRKVAVLAACAARILIPSLALIPFADAAARLWLLVALLVAITLLGAVSGCSVNSWFHQLLGGRDLGALYARRLFWSTMLASLGALLAGQLVEHGPFEQRAHAYALNFALAGVAAWIGLYFLARVPEPPMQRTGPPQPVLRMLRAPLLEPNFRRLVIFMASWNFASNLAAPFLTVYLLKQLGYGLDTVTALWAAGQIASAFTLHAWGHISDRLSNKAILSTALPAYFGCLIALPVSALPQPHELTLPLLGVIHAVMGIASGGIGLATGNIGLKLAPQGRGTAYLASVSLAGALAAGVAALAGGALAEWFQARHFSLVLLWSSPARTSGLVALNFRHWEFLFGIAFALGLYVMHALSRVREGTEVSEREVIRTLLLEAGRAMFPFGRLFDRRRRPRG